MTETAEQVTVCVSGDSMFYVEETMAYVGDIKYCAGMILILALLEKRRFRPEVCGARPALIVPLPLLDGYDNRFSYAAAFGALTNSMGILFLELTQTFSFNSPLWAKAFLLQLRILETCIVCFPLFACISTRHKLVGSVLGVTYSSLHLGASIAGAVVFHCQFHSMLTDTQAVFVLSYVPIVLCFLYLILKFLLVIVECLRSKTYVTTEPQKRVYAHQQQYVRQVLHKDYNPSTETTFCDKWIYRFVPGFKYPVRILSVVSVLVVLLYQFLFAGVYFSTLIVCVIVTSSYIYLFMKSYRRHLLRMFRGNKSFILSQLPKPHRIMACSMRFPGYQVAYMLYGFLVLFTVMFLVMLLFAWGIYLISINHLMSSLLMSLLQTLSVPASVLLLFYLQVIMAKYVLMQDKIKDTDDEPPLNVDNRRFYECFNYYAFFGNLAIGVFSCFWRILQGLILGVLMVGRLDHSIYARGWEHRDRGYLSYICMLHVENAHNHPILRVFCDLLLTDLDKDGQTFHRRVRRNTTASRRWYLAYTLINNPELTQKRKRVLNETNRKRRIVRITQTEMEGTADWPIDDRISPSIEFVSSGRNVVTNHTSSQDRSVV
ncbi:stimulated by retinoic acid gene 6 protein-like [Haliotis asinina]|uniref:stimulated by retinoic acid gene 6 protein-like n=1 Tax=Haliotis asinina TaxID=109174 RepID=UPI003531863F